MANQILEMFKFPGVPDTFIIPKSIISSEIEVTSDNYATIITNLDDQPVNTIYSYAENLQSHVSNLPSNKAMTIVNLAQKSTGGLGQVMLAVERNGSGDYLYFRTMGGSPAAWSGWVKVANNADVEAVREALDNLDIETDKTLSIDGKPADAKATGDKINDIKADLSGVKQDVFNADLYDLRRDLNYHSANWNDIVFTWDKVQSKCTITGTATAVTYNNIFISTSSLPTNIQAGDVLRVKYKASNVYLIFYDYSGGNISLIKEVKRDAIVKIPDTCTGLIIRLWIGNGTTVNETVSPEIYKNGNFLIESVDTATESESGKTDMRYIIQEMLDIYGYCKLSPGTFYISGTVMIPEHGTLEGCGESTKIYLMSGNRKAAIQLRRYGAVRNLSVIGSYTDLTKSDFSTSAGSRYGIQYYKDSSNSWTSAYSSISNVFIKNFTAAGIYQYGTGANVKQGLFVTDVHIENCWCGIWIYSNSEFCRYENVQMAYCYIDCINNGGNNAFNNCVFHAYSIGMKIDGTQNNSAHGMCANSSFCHTGDNVGSALTLDSIANGFVFSSCQFWYNSVDISSCDGIVFSGCEFGRGTTNKGATININNGNTVMFGNCVFMNDVTYPPDITVTNNTKVKFNACYGSVSGNEISA